ncbi:uncharacterized protein LOC102612797 isoform X2 [Citrus sinensis]|uniref:uncharacterized protein LOC102612797 isoform X2 n=1 Tax=Citrus sinensis TaxID=2711 RepID=UPI002278AD33|nr:uncharacterized protein LOC102612797 isoform X2 [Citrus sinensis]
MEFNFGRIDGRTAPSRSSPSPSSQSSSYSSDDQARRGGNYSMGPDLLKNPRLLYTLQREIENEIIRHEIIAAEIERRRLPEEEARRELMIEREMAMHRAREMGLSIDDRLLMQLHTRYPWFPFSRNLGLGFGHDVLPSTPPHFSHGLWSGLDVNKKDELTMLGKPDSNFCGSKPKAATPPSGSGGNPSTSSNKPKEWSCALCRFSATTERGLDVHLQGTKHKAKAAALLRNKKMFCKRGLDECLRGKKHKVKVVKLLRDKKMCSKSTSSTSKKSTQSRGCAGQKMKTKVQEESVNANKTVGGLNQKVKGALDEHPPQGKKHKGKVARLLRDKKMCSNSTSSTSKKSIESRGGADQKMKTKVQKESVKANKTVGGLNQKVKGGLHEHPQGKKHKAKVARLLRDKKMCSNSTSSTSKKSTESRGGAGQKMKTKAQEESVKANKTVVGLNQKVKGGLDGHPRRKKHKAKVARLLRDKKMCSNSTSSMSKKSKESRGVAGQKRKTKVQEESVKATESVVGLNQNVKGGLDERPQGKKHKAKVARLLRDNKMCSNSTSSTSKKSTESRGGAGQKMKTKVQEESAKATKTVVGSNQKVKGGLDEHLQGKKHKAKEEELLGAQKWTKKSTESRDIAGQEMKTKVEEKSVKANKTVVGSDQKGEGGQAQQVKLYPNLCGSKQEAATLPADSGKPCSTGSKKPMHWSCALCQVSSTSKRNLDEHLRGKKHKAKEEELLGDQKWKKKSRESRDITGQEIKTKVEEESVKANKTVVGSDQKGEGGQAQQVKPYPNLCGSNQEAATLPADSGKPCSTGSKKPMHWSCALCRVSSTSKRDLDEHLRGKKHEAKEEELLGGQKWTKKSTESIDSAGQEMKTKVEEESVKANKTVVGSDQKGEGGQAQQVKPYPNLCGSKQEAATLPADSGKPCSTGSKKPMHWSCALCQVSSTSKRDLDEHLRGKKHKAKEEELLGAQKWTKKSTESRDIAGQEMKTKVEEKSVKANKIVVGSDQKGEGGQAQQVKPYPNLCGSKQEATTLPADSGKPCSTGSKKPMHWSCALCQVSSTSKRNLDEHLRGKKHKAKEEGLEREKKHMARSNESKKNDEAVSLTTSTTIVTPLEPTEKVEDEDVVAKESNEETVDGVIENAEDEEVVVYRGRQSGPDAADSLLC